MKSLLILALAITSMMSVSCTINNYGAGGYGYNTGYRTGAGVSYGVGNAGRSVRVTTARPPYMYNNSAVGGVWVQGQQNASYVQPGYSQSYGGYPQGGGYSQGGSNYNGLPYRSNFQSPDYGSFAGTRFRSAWAH